MKAFLVIIHKEEYFPNAINLFPIKEKYFPDPVIFFTRSIGRSTRQTKGYLCGHLGVRVSQAR